MLPVGVEELTARGHRVSLQAGAGLGSDRRSRLFAGRGRIDLEHRGSLCRGRPNRESKGASAAEFALIRPGQTLFTYFHFAASRALTEAMVRSGGNCLAYETFEDQRGRLY